MNKNHPEMRGMDVEWGFLQASSDEVLKLVDEVIEGVRDHSEFSRDFVKRTDPYGWSEGQGVGCDGITHLLEVMRGEVQGAVDLSAVKKVEENVGLIRLYLVKVLALKRATKGLDTMEAFSDKFDDLEGQDGDIQPFHGEFFSRWSRKAENYEDCRCILGRMKSVSVKPNVKMLTSMFRKCAGFGERSQLYSQILSFGKDEGEVKLDEAFFNDWIKLQQRDGDRDAVLSYMVDKGIRPSIKTFTNYLTYCSSARPIMDVLDAVQAFGVTTDVKFVDFLSRLPVSPCWRAVYSYIQDDDKWAGTEVLEFVHYRASRDLV